MSESQPQQENPIYRTEADGLVVFHGQKFQDELQEGLKEKAKKDVEEFIHPDIRVIETEEQVKQVIEELNEIQDPKAKALAKQQALNLTMQKMDALWRGLSRRQKRNVVRKRNPGLQFSNRVKKSLQIKKSEQPKREPYQKRGGPMVPVIPVGEGLLSVIEREGILSTLQ